MPGLMGFISALHVGDDRNTWKNVNFAPRRRKIAASGSISRGEIRMHVSLAFRKSCSINHDHPRSIVHRIAFIQLYVQAIPLLPPTCKNKHEPLRAVSSNVFDLPSM